MKVMIFIDKSNFHNSTNHIKSERKQDRIINYNKINKFVLNYLEHNFQYKHKTLSHIRTYLYDGEYTDALINKIRSELPRTKGDEKERIMRILERTLNKSKGQKSLLKKTENYYYFETRLKPLQFAREKGVFQKGVDVQLAVDLVSGAYLNTYDIAVLFSGDIDLLESVRLVKNLGKHVVIFSHWNDMSVGMRKIADMYVNIQKLTDKQLDEFTHIFEKKKE